MSQQRTGRIPFPHPGETIREGIWGRTRPSHSFCRTIIRPTIARADFRSDLPCFPLSTRTRLQYSTQLFLQIDHELFRPQGRPVYVAS